MSKAPGESRIPTLNSRIPKPGKFHRFIPSLNTTTLKILPTDTLKYTNTKSQIVSSTVNETFDKPRKEEIIPNINNETRIINPNLTQTIENKEIIISDKIFELVQNEKGGDTFVKEVDKIDETNDKCTFTKNESLVNEVDATLPNIEDKCATIVLDSNKIEATFIQHHPQEENVIEISEKDLEKRVLVGNVQCGVLKYVGSVKFGTGIWCGVELNSPVGRHDGCVKGTRYFTCQDKCGVIAPIAKVVLLSEENRGSQPKEDKFGPFSLIEVELSKINETFLQEERNNVDKNIEITNKRLTKVLESHKCSKSDKRSSIISGTYYKHVDSSQELDKKYHATSTPAKNEKKRRSAEVSYTFSTISPLDISDEHSEGNVAKKQFFTSPTGSPVETPTLPKQNSFEMDESLGILTPEQMKEFSQFTANFKMSSSDDLKSLTVASRLSDKSIGNSRTPSSENLGTLLPEGFVKPQSTLRPTTIELGDKVTKLKVAELSSPNMVDQSTMDYSLGLLDEDVLASATFCTSQVDTTTNLELPLDSINLKGDFKSLYRSDQTPSPEDLPLDPIDPKMELEVIPPSGEKSENPKSTSAKTSNSFITSITSITSLDTGYQGDGEMSRPASRGADHSPGAHKPNNAVAVNLHWQRAIARRQDPMTDSDFFTESDADVHDEMAPKGDRRAQVIDGTLYGANPQSAAAAADIYINNQEEMDSSGIFTDFDTNPRTEDLSDGERNKDPTNQMAINDKSPSDISSKSISENSQQRPEVEINQNDTLVNEIITNGEEIATLTEENLKSPTQSIISTTSSRKSQRTRTPLPKEDCPTKKAKMPKRNVPSKVKTMLEGNAAKSSEEQETSRKVRKSVNKWDAVMSKISKGEDDKAKIKLTQVKSKVSTGIGSTRKNDGKEDTTKTKVRRVRARVDLQSSKQNSRTTSSIHSSVSDLSIGVPPVKQISPSASQRSAKKREAIRCATPVTEVLTAQGAKQQIKVSPRSSPRQQIIKELKKSPVQQSQTSPNGKPASVGRRTPTRHTITGTKAPPAKDQSRVNGAAVSVKEKQAASQAAAPHDTGGHQIKPPVVAPPNILPRLLPHLGYSAKGFEALSVLVHHLVFNLEAFKTPAIKQELEDVKTKWQRGQLELEEIKMGYRKLEDTLQEQKILSTNTIDEERKRCRSEITELFEKHRQAIDELNVRHQEEIQQIDLRHQNENFKLKAQLDKEISSRENDVRRRLEAFTTEHNLKIKDRELKNDRLKQEHQITLEILREENDSIRDQLDDKNAIIQDLEELKILNDRLKIEINEKERFYEEKLSNAQDEIQLLKEENRKILETFKSDTKDNKLHAALGRCTQLQDEVESLRSVLDLKLAELAELRTRIGELTQAAEELPGAIYRCQTLQARVEDLELQLARKTDLETQLTKENKRLSEICTQETKQKKRLSLYNEELQWKLKQNSEVVNALIQGQSPSRKPMHDQSEQSLNDESLQFKTPSGSFLSRSLHSSSFNEKHYFTHSFDRTLSFKEKSRNCTSPINKSNRSAELFDLEVSPPSSPKVKGVVEKSDSVSWVLDLDESPEVLVSRMVRRSFRSSTPPKNTPKHLPVIKRARTKSNTLSLSASSSAIVPSSTKSDRFRSKSVSLRDNNSPERTTENTKSWQLKSLRKQKSIDQSDSRDNIKIAPSEPNCQKNGAKGSSFPDGFSSDIMHQSWHSEKRQEPKKLSQKNGDVRSEVMFENWDGSNVKRWQSQSISVIKSKNSPDNSLATNEDIMCKSWHYCTCTSTPSQKQKNQNSMHDCDFENEINLCLPKLPSEIIRPKDSESLSCSDKLCLSQQINFPKNSAGEAMISESNSEDEFSSSIEERSPSLSDTENSEENNSSRHSQNNDDNITLSKQSSKMQYDLFLMTESTNTNSEEIMVDFSSSEELES